MRGLVKARGWWVEPSWLDWLLGQKTRIKCGWCGHEWTVRLPGKKAADCPGCDSRNFRRWR